MKDQQHIQEYDIDIRPYTKAIIKRKNLILCIVIAGMVLATVVSLIQPKLYKSTALIMIVPSRMQRVLLSDEASLDYKRDSIMETFPGQSTTTSLATHRLLLGTPVVVGMIIDRLQLKDKAGKRISPEDLLKRMKVGDSKDTNVLQLNVIDSNPERAQKLANAWAQEYIVYNQELISGEVRGTGGFVIDQFEIAKNNLTKIEASIKDFNDEYKTNLMRVEINIKRNILNKYRRELPSLEMALKTKEDVLIELKKEIAKQGRFIVVSKAITDEALWQKSSKEENIGDLDKKKLKSEEINPIYRNLETRIVNTEIELNTIKPRIEYLEGAIKSINKEINSLEKITTQKEFELVQLNRQMEIYKRTYDNLSLKIERARIAKAVQLGEVKIVSPAVMPKKPVGAGSRLVIVFVGILSLILGITITFFLEFRQKAR